MFEDFKDKVLQKTNQQKQQSSSFSPEVLELKRMGIDSNNVTIQQLFPESLDERGNDVSLMSGAETEIMITYLKTRKYLLEKYPQSQEEARLIGKPWLEEPEEPNQIDVMKAYQDPCRKTFAKALMNMAAIYEKVDVLQHNASDYEKICLRFYWYLTYNWNHSDRGIKKILNDDLL
jgi:hypothetical protein